MIIPLLDDENTSEEIRHKRWLEFEYNGGGRNVKRMLIPSIPKCACSTIEMFYNKLNNKKVKHRTKHQHLLPDAFNIDSYIDIREQNLDNCLVCCVIRDPLERIISSYHTFTNIDAHYHRFTFNEYIKSVVLTLQNYNEYEQDRHIRSQFWFYDIDKVDLFIPINRLDSFLKTIDHRYNNRRYNVSKYKQKFISNKELNSLLKEDYKIYNSIIKKNKLFS